MAEVSFNIKEQGEGRGAGDLKDIEAFKSLKETVNGKLDHTNLSAEAAIAATQLAGNVPDTKLASPNNSAYRTMIDAAGVYEASTTGTKYFSVQAVLQAATITAGLTLFYFAKADYEVAGKTQKLRLRAQQITGGTGPGTTMTFGLYPVSSTSGGAFTVGSVVAGSTVAFASTASNTRAQNNSGDFTIPEDGYYILGVANSGTTASFSNQGCYCQLQARSV